MKDSYANCFVQFLYPHYDRIIMVDPRYYYGDLENLISSQSVTDVLYVDFQGLKCQKGGPYLDCPSLYCPYKLGQSIPGVPYDRRKITKEKAHPFGWALVDDIGLEPMTFRTSSGCSSQLS